jgi:hypothetical protein
MIYLSKKVEIEIPKGHESEPPSVKKTKNGYDVRIKMKKK